MKRPVSPFSSFLSKFKDRHKDGWVWVPPRTGVKGYWRRKGKTKLSRPRLMSPSKYGLRDVGLRQHRGGTGTPQRGMW